jgi:hypothetical protein
MLSSLLLKEGGGGLPGTCFFFIPEKDTDEYTSCGHSKLLCWRNGLYSMCSAFLQKRVVLRFINWVQVHQFVASPRATNACPTVPTTTKVKPPALWSQWTCNTSALCWHARCIEEGSRLDPSPTWSTTILKKITNK